MGPCPPNWEASPGSLSTPSQSAWPRHLRRLLQWLSIISSQQVATGLGCGALGLLLSCPRPNTGSSWPWFTVRPPTHAPRSSTGSIQLHIALELLPGSPRQVTDKSEIGLHRSPSQEEPETKHPAASLRSYQSTAQLAPQAVHPKGRLNRHNSLLGQIHL